ISISIIKGPWRLKSSRSFNIKNPCSPMQEEGRKTNLKIKPLLVGALYLVFVSEYAKIKLFLKHAVFAHHVLRFHYSIPIVVRGTVGVHSVRYLAVRVLLELPQ